MKDCSLSILFHGFAIELFPLLYVIHTPCELLISISPKLKKRRWQTYMIRLMFTLGGII